MGRIVVLGAGVVGLATAMMLNQYGYQVTVVERDAAAVPASPEQAWTNWERSAVRQFRQAHYLHPRARQLLAKHLPNVLTSLRNAGAADFDVLSTMPGTIADRTPRAGDDRFLTLTARRPVLEYAVARSAAGLLDVRRGRQVSGLLTSDPAASGDVPSICGVQLADGEKIVADLVVDATGRASKLPSWLRGIGARPPVDISQAGGFSYYTKYFRGDCLPSFPPDGLVSPVGSLTILTVPADANTWSVTLVTSSGDHALKGLRQESSWARALAAFPGHLHWQDAQAITGIITSAGAMSRHRRLVMDGSPLVTGVLAVGDSWAYTDPALARGVTLGLMHAAVTCEVIHDHLDDAVALALAHDQAVQAELSPWHRNTVRISETRAAEVEAEISGHQAEGSNERAITVSRALSVAMKHDADLFRAYLDLATLQTSPQEVLSRPGLTAQVVQVASRYDEPPRDYPTRAEILELTAAH